MKPTSRQDRLYEAAAAEHKHALERLVRAYEANRDKQQDLLQDIHVALWQSFEGYAERCSLRTWVYRVAHNTAASHALRERRTNSRWTSLDDIGPVSDPGSAAGTADRKLDLGRLLEWIRRLKPVERQLILLYLEGMDADSIGEIVGISSGNVRVQIHRIKTAMRRRFGGGVGND